MNVIQKFSVRCYVQSCKRKQAAEGIKTGSDRGKEYIERAREAIFRYGGVCHGLENRLRSQCLLSTRRPEVCSILHTMKQSRILGGFEPCSLQRAHPEIGSNSLGRILERFHRAKKRSMSLLPSNAGRGGSKAK